MTFIRPETIIDIAAIHRVNSAAFPSPAEANLVHRLREEGLLTYSLVAIEDGQIVGHIALSPVILLTKGNPTALFGLGLAPVAVAPTHQKRGIGSAMIREGLIKCKEASERFVVVLGEPEYYHRFGFRRAMEWNIANEYGVDDPFMAIVWRKDALPKGGGIARYSQSFAELT